MIQEAVNSKVGTSNLGTIKEVDERSQQLILSDGDELLNNEQIKKFSFAKYVHSAKGPLTNNAYQQP